MKKKNNNKKQNKRKKQQQTTKRIADIATSRSNITCIFRFFFGFFFLSHVWTHGTGFYNTIPETIMGMPKSVVWKSSFYIIRDERLMVFYFPVYICLLCRVSIGTSRK